MHIRISITYRILATGGDPYDVFIGLLNMVQLRARPDNYRMVLKIDYRRDYEILNYECDCDSGNTSEDELPSECSDEYEQEIKESIAALVKMLKEPENKTESCNEGQLIDQKLSHLNAKDADSVKESSGTP